MSLQFPAQFPAYRPRRLRQSPALRRLVSVGRLGRASGSGFFDYGERAEETGPASVR